MMVVHLAERMESQMAVLKVVNWVDLTVDCSAGWMVGG